MNTTLINFQTYGSWQKWFVDFTTMVNKNSTLLAKKNQF